MYNLILVDVGVHHDRTFFHRMNVITGDYLRPYVKNNMSYSEMIDDLIEIIYMEKPDKIIFMKNSAYDRAFYEGFLQRLKVHPQYKGTFEVDAFGLITHNWS